MNALEFYKHFLAAFSAESIPEGLVRMGGKTPKWKYPLSYGTLKFRLATNSKTAGLLDHGVWPGEFRLRAFWIKGRGKERLEHYVSIFQYTTDEEVESFTKIHRGALRKFLDANGDDPYGSLSEQLTDDIAKPVPNVDTFYCYFDRADAESWGRWYGRLIKPWVTRFKEAPETHEDWSWRMLWPHLNRPES